MSHQKIENITVRVSTHLLQFESVRHTMIPDIFLAEEVDIARLLEVARPLRHVLKHNQTRPTHCWYREKQCIEEPESCNTHDGARYGKMEPWDSQ